jgi:hypothetical protein
VTDIETAKEDLAAATSDTAAEIKVHLHHRLADLLYQRYMRREDDLDKERDLVNGATLHIASACDLAGRDSPSSALYASEQSKIEESRKIPMTKLESCLLAYQLGDQKEELTKMYEKLADLYIRETSWWWGCTQQTREFSDRATGLLGDAFGACAVRIKSWAPAEIGTAVLLTCLDVRQQR